jgi:hypothetical protein
MSKKKRKPRIKCEHVPSEPIIMPEYYIHYSKIICVKCKINLGWGKKPKRNDNSDIVTYYI